MQDKGGRSWAGYSPSPGASSSRDNLPAAGAAAGSSSSKAQPTTKSQPTQPTGGYAASSSRRAVDVVHDTPQPLSADASPSAAPAAVEVPHKQASNKPAAATPVAQAPMSVLPVVTTSVPSVSTASQPTQTTIPDLATATRVRALHNFEPAAAGELAFEKGDVIKVVDRTHKDWWKGQLKGRTGIFPVNYVVCMKCIRLSGLTPTSGSNAGTYSGRSRSRSGG
jgi:signal transducing adaptor molecule